MATTLHCDIVSAEKSIFSGPVEMIVATGVLGDLGIVPGHAALLTQLIPGPVKLTMEGGTEEIFYVSGGFLEVQPGTATLLADTAERAEDLDEAAAAKAIADAEQDIADRHADFDYGSAAARIAEAAAQLREIGRASCRERV